MNGTAEKLERLAEEIETTAIRAAEALQKQDDLNWQFGEENKRFILTDEDAENRKKEDELFDRLAIRVTGKLFSDGKKEFVINAQKKGNFWYAKVDDVALILDDDLINEERIKKYFQRIADRLYPGKFDITITV